MQGTLSVPGLGVFPAGAATQQVRSHLCSLHSHSVAFLRVCCACQVPLSLRPSSSAASSQLQVCPQRLQWLASFVVAFAAYETMTRVRACGIIRFHDTDRGLTRLQGPGPAAALHAPVYEAWRIKPERLAVACQSNGELIKLGSGAFGTVRPTWPGSCAQA